MASCTAVALIREALFRPSTDMDADFNQRTQSSAGIGASQHAVQRAVAAANQAVFGINRADGIREGQGMGTTLAGAYLPAWGTEGVIFHVGDCRVYLFRDERLIALTQDHSLYQDWQRSGQAGPAPKKSIVLRAVGPWANVEVEMQPYQPHSGDLLLICSDGLTDMVSHEELERYLINSGGTTLDTRCTELIDLANDNGGTDNITAVLVFIC